MLDDIKLSPDQEEAVALIRKYLSEGNAEGYFFLEGGAGTGKTTILKQIAEQYDMGVRCLAYTGKAVANLKEKLEGTVAECRTLHSYLKVCAFDKNTGKLIKEDWRAPRDIDAFILIIDECSMVPPDMFHYLQDALSHIPKIYVGDNRQLPPTKNKKDQEDSPFFVNKAHYGLTTIHRQKEGSDLLDLAYLYRNKTKDIIISESENVKILPYKASSFVLNRRNTQFIAYTNEMCGRINSLIRKANITAGGLDDSLIHVGDRLMCLANKTGNTEVFNGTQLTVKEIIPHSDDLMRQSPALCEVYQNVIFEEFPDMSFKVSLWHLKESIGEDTGLGRYSEKRRPYVGSDIDVIPFAFAYCITCHKSQGSEYDNVGIVMDCREGNEIYYPFYYTAVTRAKHKVYMIDPPDEYKK